MSEGHAPWRVVVVGSSHNDIGWAGTPSEIAEHRERNIIDGVIDLLARDPNYAYAVEASLYADEYLERNPQRTALIRDLVDSGRLEWGGTYVQPYEGLYSGEALIRQAEYGRRAIGQRWGIRSRGAWNVDVQGRTRNLASFYRPAGIEYLVVSRCEPGLYWWEAQDGTRLLVLSLMQGHYGYPFLNSRELHSSPLEAAADGDGGFTIDGAAKRLRSLTEHFAPFFDNHGLPRAILVCVTADYTVPSEALSRFIACWNENAEAIAEEHGVDARLEYGTADRYFRILAAEASLEDLPIIRGEMPNPWLYIHGPGHHKTVDALRRGQAALLTAEQLLAVRHPAGLPASDRSNLELARAWRDHLYTDHGFGGLHGVGTDEVFRMKAESALHIANVSIEESLTTLAADAGLGRDEILVYNPLSFLRTDWVEVEVEFDGPADATSVALRDTHGATVPGHVLGTHLPVGTRSGWARIGFLAGDVPALSSVVYRVEDARGPDDGMTPDMRWRRARPAGSVTWENSFYGVSISRGGVDLLRDATTGVRTVDASRYLLGEVIALDSPGVDVGQHEHDGSWDFRAPAPFQPLLTGLERAANRGTEPRVLLEAEDIMRVATETSIAGALVRTTYSFYRDLPYFDLRVDVIGWPGHHARELRICFPFAGTEAEVTYEVPGGHVRAGRDELPGFAGMRPREVQNWIQATHGGRALTVSGHVAVWDWLDVDSAGPVGTVLQGVLLASKRSCHLQGNWYDQAGDHVFQFRVDPTGAGAGSRQALGDGFAFPLRARRGADAPGRASRAVSALPAWLVPGVEGIAITSIKPLDDGLLVRYQEHEGRSVTVDLSGRPPGTQVFSADPFGDGQELLPERFQLHAHARRTIVVRASHHAHASTSSKEWE